MDNEKPSGADATGEDLMNSAMVRAVLRELMAKLTSLAADGLSDRIDLRRLPLPPGALDALRTWLGNGEVEATVTALGVTTIRETAVSGVWWVHHAKSAGEIFSEHLEISRSPELLSAQPDDVTQAADSLRSRLSALDSSSPHPVS
jgi:hydrogenase-1 operon protein HyaF